MSDRYAGRSVHGAPQHARRFAENPIIRIEGCVARSLALSPSDLAALERVRFLDIAPPESRSVWPEKDWAGVRISDLLTLAGVDSNARWIQVLGGPMASVLPIDQAGTAFLLDRLDDQPIAVEFGGPFRLASLELRYNLCVKWVDSIIVAELEPDRSAERIAIARQRARDFQR